MISNTSGSELNLADQAGLDEYHTKLQSNTSTPSKLNNNNNEISKNGFTTFTQISTDQRKITNPSTFYTTSGIGNSIPINECTAVIEQHSSDDFAKNSSSQPKCFDYDPCSYFNSTQEKELTKVLKKNRNESALNNFSRLSGCGVISLMHGVDQLTSDTRSNLISSKTSTCSSKNSKGARQETPMFRTEDQEHAFRQIKDVHNYSKLNRYGYCNNEMNQVINISTYSSNSSNQDEDDDDEEEDEGEEKDDEDFDIVDYERLTINKKLSGNGIKRIVPVIKTQQQNKKQDFVSQDVFKTGNEGNITTPDHHARRPMNAFLIFCKRHRCIVKDKYKNYENRSITKILGEWWASLDANDKKCYVNLAKQNKDAFFSANPNFKWYKLPAPSLRTLNTRPGNIERREDQCELGDLSKQNNLNYHTVSTCDNMSSSTEAKKVSYFKLADEKQMGGLSNLMSPITSSASKNVTLQIALTEASTIIDSSCNRKSIITEKDCSNIKRSHSDKSKSSSEDDLTPKKSVRSCKGKKYQELINSGQISAVTSKKIISTRPSTNMNNSESGQYFVMQIDKSSKVKSSSQNQLLSKKEEAKPKADSGQWVTTHYKDSYGLHKPQFGFVSFDLEDKIRSLPAQCLETYLQRKKNTKRKKKMKSKNHFSPQQRNFQEGFLKQTAESSLYQPKTALEAKEQIIGSQKRKARKESITRRDITSIQNDVPVLLDSSHVTSAFVIGRRSPISQLLPVVNRNATPDLLILAEVAANRTETAQ